MYRRRKQLTYSRWRHCGTNKIRPPQGRVDEHCSGPSKYARVLEQTSLRNLGCTGGRMLKRLALIGCSAAAVAAQPGWYPHEGGLLKYRVNIRFGEEPKDTMPEA